jgi:hypothetical protein
VAEPEVVEVARILVRAEMPGRSVRVTITLPEDLLAAVNRYVACTGHTRSGLLALAVRTRMERDRDTARGPTGGGRVGHLASCNVELGKPEIRSSCRWLICMAT